jgi:hypothetical protein
MKINFENKKYLLTSGCSFTDGFGMREKGSWAYYLADKLGLNLINKARGGSGNEYISDSIIIELMNNPEIRDNCVVGVAWSSFSRLMTSLYDGEWNVICTVQPYDFLNIDNNIGRFYEHRKAGEVFFRDILFCMYKTYMAITKLNRFLDSYNIPYFYIDAITKNKVENVDSVIHYYDLIGGVDTIELAGWPSQYLHVFHPSFNDTIFNNFIKIGEHETIHSLLQSNYDYFTEGNPGHPNDKASIEVSNLIYNQIK